VSPLFAKILAWFVLAVLITVLAITLSSTFGYKQSGSPGLPFSMLMTLQGMEARHAWDIGGRKELAKTINRFLRVTQARGIVFARVDGTDLLTGESERELVESARRHLVFCARGGMVFSRFSNDGKYCFLWIGSPFRMLVSNLQPAHLAVLLVVIGLCYGLAFHVMSPLRSLQQAVEKFGKGDWSARAPENRRDELGDVARTFNKMARRLEASLSAQQRLLLDISHELRSPLARLGVAIELSRSGQPTLDRIQKEADRLNELIGQMLEVARIENDPKYRRIEAVQLDELIGDLVDDCTIEAQARGCALALETPSAVLVDGDRELLRRAIENVVRNAIRYAPSESRVEVALENGGGRARVKVRDYGPGVPEAALGLIFDPFYRVEPDRNRVNGGYGLGLSIARRAVELHHGSLRARNASPGLLVEIELLVSAS
jgi:signal transduction histidine kinase